MRRQRGSKKLLWLDIIGAQLFRYDPATKSNEAHDLSTYSSAVSSVVPTDSELVAVTLREGFATGDALSGMVRGGWVGLLGVVTSHSHGF